MFVLLFDRGHAAQNKTPMFKIDVLKHEIKTSLAENDVTLVSTSTGSGKTMRVPQWCNELSGEKVYCLVPRVVMARQAASGANSLVWEDKTAGCMTGRGDVKGTSVVYATEGSFLSRNTIHSMTAGSYLVIDEIHEQGAMTAMLLLLAKTWIAERGIKLVLLSATVDVAKYEAYFNELSFGAINMPESPRPFKTEFITSVNPIGDIINAAQDGGRALIGVSGKREIEDLCSFIMKTTKVPVYPVHGELEVEDMDTAIAHKGNVIYVATNILQSGVTIPDLTHGYFSGKGKRIVDSNGVATLEEYLLAKAEMTQWYGRIGRNCDGVVFVEPHDHHREEMPTAEILLAPLMDTYLEFMRHGVNISRAVLVDSPPLEKIAATKAALEKLLITNEIGLTPLGHAVAEQGAGVRMGIVKVLGDALGLSNTARKIAAIEYVGHPFRNTNFSMGDKCSDYQVWIETIDGYVAEFGGRVSYMDKTLFVEKATKEGVFRRSMTRLMPMFEQIDMDFEDVSQDEIFVKALMYMANRDRVVGRDVYWIRPSNKSAVARQDLMVGQITNVGRATFIEGMTTLSADDAVKIEKLVVPMFS